jgi:eukaryotic-like serine/threonine-protein kinase
MDSVRAQNYSKEFIGKKIDGWTICGLIGNGASAVVFEAERDGIKAAIKIFDHELVERYGEEHQFARIQLELGLIGRYHPNLVKILGGGKCAVTGCLYVIMEKLYFEALSAQIAKFPTAQIRPVISQIADAAKFLESISLVHRDIKPDNIAISEDFTHAVLLDFGVLRPLDTKGEELRGSGLEFIATTRYASPEYLMRTEENSIEGWRSLTYYQLGGVLHDLIMHKKLFEEFGPPQPRLTDAVRQIVPVIDNQEVPADLRELARNCLQKNWRLRLQLVNWEDFSANPPSLFDLNLVRDRIRKRRAAASGFQNLEQESENVDSKKQSILNDTADLAIALIREIRTKTQDFPAHKITSDRANLNEIRIMVAMGPSETYALGCRLVVLIRIEVLDVLSSAVRISVVFRSDGEESWPTSCKWEVLFAGTIDTDEISRYLENLLYTALDQAQLNPNHSKYQVPLLQGDKGLGKNLVD